jgi:hypothetical protein
VQITEGLSAGVPAMLTGPLAPAYLGADAAGREAERAKAVGATPEQREQAIRRAADIGALAGTLSTLVPGSSLVAPARSGAVGFSRLFGNTPRLAAVGGATALATGEPLRYLAGENTATYDPYGGYSYNPDQSLADLALAAVMPFAQRRLPIITPQQDSRRLTYNTGQRVLETIATDHPLLKPPEREEWVPARADIAALNGAIRSAGLRSGLPIEGHHQFALEFEPWWSNRGINPDDWLLYMQRGQHRELPGGLHTGSDNWNAQQRSALRGLPEIPELSYEVINGMLRQLYGKWP